MSNLPPSAPAGPAGPAAQATQAFQVVVAYDFSPSAEQALSRAIDVVARAPQHVLHVVIALDPHDRLINAVRNGSVSYQTADEVQVLARDRIAATFGAHGTTEAVQFYVHARIGKAADEILDVAEQVGADLLFVGSHNKAGLERWLLGSVSERVVRYAGCPVMVVRPKTYADVQLLKVTRYDHQRAHHREPHRYTYTNNQVIMRPKDWPLI
ncbi:MAG: universal stress protein [Kofleriaceae bacterium]